MAVKQFLRSKDVKALALSLPGALFIIFFLFLPLATIVVYSFWRTESYTMIADWNLDNYLTILTTKTYLTFLVRSLVMSITVSFISLVYSWPVAYYIAKYGGRYRLILTMLTAAPFFTGILLRVTAMQQILGPIGVVNMFLSNIGLKPLQFLMYSHYATGLGLIYLWIPFMVLAIYLSLLTFDFKLLDAAMINGASPLRAFWEVTLPLNWIGTCIGLALVFIPTFAATITPKFLGGVNGALYGNILAHQFGSTGTWALGSAMGVLMFTISSLFVFLVFKTVNLNRSGYTGKLTGE